MLVYEQVVLPDALYSVSIRMSQLAFAMCLTELPLPFINGFIRPYHFAKAVALIFVETSLVTATRGPFFIAGTLSLTINQVTSIVDFLHEFPVCRNNLWNKPIAFAVHFSFKKMAVVPLTAR